MVTERHALARLIDAVKDANAWSDVDVTAAARRHGHDLSKSNISRIRQQNPLVSITAATLRGLAAGLGVSIEQVALAALDSMGIVVARYDVATPEQAIRLDVDLSARDRAVLLGMLTTMREAPEGADHVPRPRARPTRPSSSSEPPAAPEGEKTRRRRPPPFVDDGPDPNVGLHPDAQKFVDAIRQVDAERAAEDQRDYDLAGGPNDTRRIEKPFIAGSDDDPDRPGDEEFSQDDGSEDGS